MKKLIQAMVGILLICFVSFIGMKHLQNKQGITNENMLTLYNWGDYLDPNLIKKFENQTGYRVSVETFDSNEAMLTKIKQGGTAYDLAVPSDYMIEKMRKADLLAPLDKTKLPALKNIDANFLDLPFDPKNRYSIPYFWGTLGIIYNDQFVKQPITSWQDLWQKQYRQQIMVVDSARDMLGATLIKEGYSVNSQNKAHLQQAKRQLQQLMPNVKAIVADEIKMYMTQNEAALAVTWSGEAAEMMANNSHLHYVIPEEGSNMWFDNLVIPKTAKHKKAAYAFLNFMLQPDNAAQNAEYVGYSTPNKIAKTQLPKAISQNKAFYPDKETIQHLQVYRDLSPQMVGYYNDLFLSFKMYR